MTTLPNPFLSASDGLHPLSSVAVTLGVDPTALESVTAEIQSSCGAVDGHRRFITLTETGVAPLAECDGTSGITCGRPADLPETARINPRPHEALNHTEAATDCINEIFTFARGLMRDYQPDFQELLNEIAPFPMEYLPDYRLGDDDQPLFLQGAVA